MRQPRKKHNEDAAAMLVAHKASAYGNAAIFGMRHGWHNTRSYP